MDFDPNNFRNQQYLPSLFPEKPSLMRQDSSTELPPLIPSTMFSPFQSSILIPSPANNTFLHPNANSHFFHDNNILNVQNTQFTPSVVMETPPSHPSPNYPLSMTTKNNMNPFSTFSFGESSSSHNNNLSALLFAPQNNNRVENYGHNNLHGHNNTSGDDKNKGIMWDFEQKALVLQPQSPLAVGGADQEHEFLLTRAEDSHQGLSLITGNDNELQANEQSRQNQRPKMQNGLNNFTKGQWSPNEDSALKQLVEQYGEKKWSHIAKKLIGRIGKQCRERWHNHLKPEIRKDPWTVEEDMALIKAHQEVGNKWAVIAKRIPGRTENTIKNRYNATMRRLNGKKNKSKIRFSSTPSQDSVLQAYIKRVTTKTEEAEKASLAKNVGGGYNDLGPLFRGRERQDFSHSLNAPIPMLMPHVNANGSGNISIDYAAVR